MLTRGFDILVVCFAAAVLGAVGCSSDSKDDPTPTASVQFTATPAEATATPGTHLIVLWPRAFGL